MLTFAAAVFFLIVTPGPGVLSAAGVGSAFGFRQATRYLIGLFIGSNIVGAAVISGLAAVILANPAIRTVLMAASLAYLFYLAAKIAFAGAKIAFMQSKRGPGIGAGIMLQVINPKAYAVNTALFSGFSFAPDNYTFEVAMKLAIMYAIWLPIHLGWAYAGASLHRLNLSTRAQRRINYAMAAAMLMVVLLALFSSFFA
ncbi:LysE family translocator [Celeribacter marinus]|uniref:Transporter, LysE family n=1 Tax=Celeribacter marinus TaxID=1397108 RepID=A0A0N9ZKG1_9RHOB|nr:LysE family transporter [Celeribacter marinus]ALI56172.1 transporter, LysE family [Celeribacter marinus]SFK85898.1 Threonine/homoserine/homoserine lactone efflux protein [Celeribacter marinus]